MPVAVHIGARADGEQIVLEPEHRRRNLVLVGEIGAGKTRLLDHLIKQDMLARHGVVVLDPSGNLYTRLAKFCAGRGLHRRRKLHFWNPNDPTHVIGFNPLARREGEPVTRRVDAVAEACAHVWDEDPRKTPLLKRILTIIFTALVEHNMTLIEGIDLALLPVTAEEDERRRNLTNVQSEYVARVWRELDHLRPKEMIETFSSANNRLSDFVRSEPLKRVFGLGDGSIDLRRCMDEGHAVIVNLADAGQSVSDANILGTLLLNELLTSARQRDEQTARQAPMYVYCDECWRFLTPDLEQGLDFARQFGLHYVLAHQRLSQLGQRGSKMRSAVTGIRNRVCFGDSQHDDAIELAEELFSAQYNPNEEVEALRRPVVAGYQLRKNLTYRNTRGVSGARGVAKTAVATQHQGSSLGLSLPTDAYGMLAGDFQSAGGLADASGTATGLAMSQVGGESANEAHGWSESLWPLLEERPGAVRTYTEQMASYAQRLQALPKRRVYFRLAGQTPIILTVPWVGDSIVRDRRLPSFFAAAAERSEFTWSSDTVEANRLSRRQKNEGLSLIDELDEPESYFE